MLAILTVAASGSGIPMCVSLLARAAEPCAMHQHKSGHGAAVIAGHDVGDACHNDAEPGCVSGGTCPAGGSAASLAAQPVLSAPAFAADAAFTIDPTPHSFFSAPLPPPPQV
jgi:hypothetical protein